MRGIRISSNTEAISQRQTQNSQKYQHYFILLIARQYSLALRHVGGFIKEDLAIKLMQRSLVFG